MKFSSLQIHHRSPFFNILFVICIIFITEMLLMKYVNHSSLNPFHTALLDSLLLIIFASPGLYFLFLKPFKQQKRLLQYELELNRDLAILGKSLLGEDYVTGISNTVLAKAKHLTGSAYGYVGHIDQDTGALVCTTMTRDIWDKCSVPDKDIVFHEYKGLWGWVLREKKPLFTNKPMKEPCSNGIPDGHVEIEKFLSVPALIGDELVGQIALANPDRDYTASDLEAVGQLADYYALALRQQQYYDAIEKSEKLYKELFDNNPLPMWIHDSETMAFVAVNDTAVRNYGYSHQEFLAMNVPDLTPRNETLDSDENTQCLTDGTEKQVLHRHIKKNGTIICVEMTSHPISYHGRRCELVLVNDITDRIKADERITLLNNLINQSNDSIFVIDPASGEFVYVNKKACQRLGMTMPELLEKTIFDIASNIRTIDDWRMHINRMKKEGSRTFEAEQIRKDGSRVPVEVNATLVRLEDSEYLLSVARDITERKQAADALVAEKNKLEAVINALGDGLTVQDRDFRILYQNPVHEARQGRHLGELCYKAYQNRDTICSGCLLQQCFADGKIHRRETRAETESGVMHMEVSASPLLDAKGEIIGGIEMVRDITERKQMENQVRQTQKMEALGSLAGGIAHDFNNILTAIIGFSELLKYDIKPGTETYDNLNEVLKAGKRAKELVNQILTFSRRTEQETSPVDMQVVLREVVRLLRATIPASITIRQEIGPNCGTVMADPVQIHQVIMNLCTNAHHAMRETGGTLSVGLEKITFAKGHTFEFQNYRLEPGNYVKLTVGDTGHGIAEENLPRIFEPYFTTKSAGEGTGLGLSVVLGIVKNYNGHIEVTSHKDAGTTFEVFLPQYSEKTETERETFSGLHRGTESILVVDDEKDIVLLTKRMLEMLGYRIDTRINSTQALDDFRADPVKYDLVITDMTMPQMTGDILSRELLKIRPELPIILCTGFNENMDEVRARKTGVKKFLYKPYDLQLLAESVREVLDNK